VVVPVESRHAATGERSRPDVVLGLQRAAGNRAVVKRCMLVPAVGGGLTILATLLAAPDILAPELSTQGIAYVLTAVAGPFWGPVVLAIVAASIFSAALAISASATRVMFSMARDGQLPFGKAPARISPRTHTPTLPGVVVGVLSIGVLLINLGQTSVFATVTAISVVVVYAAYLFVTIPLLVQRLRRNPAHVPDPAYSTLGRWGPGEHRGGGVRGVHADQHRVAAVGDLRPRRPG
jgi:amino acid transporter